MAATPASLYSLEKLIEWKLTCNNTAGMKYIENPLYSLEKLIEWKQKVITAISNPNLDEPSTR